MLRRREDLRRNFVRANSAVAVILFALLALAVAAVVASLRASHNQELAEAATRERQSQLADSLRAQARAVRLAGQVGRRFDALTAISNAVAFGASTELRSEAIACLALTDVTIAQSWPQVGDAPALAFVTFDESLSRYATSPDNRQIDLINTAASNQVVRLDLEALPGGVGRRSAGFVFSPDGRYLAARLIGGGTVVWETATGRVTFNCLTNGEFLTGGMPAFTQDSRALIFCDLRSGTNLVRLNVASGEVKRLLVATGPKRLFVLHPQGQRVAVANQDTVEIWNLATGACERRLEYAGSVTALAWSGDGRLLAAGTIDGDLSIRDLELGTVRQLNAHRAAILRVLFNPHGEEICTYGEDGNSRLWEAVSGRPLLTLEGMALQFSAAGQRLGFYRPGTGLGIWQLARADAYQILRERNSARGAGWKSDLSSDGRWLALANANELYVWDLDSRRPPLTLSLTNLHSVFWHPHEPVLFLVRDGRIETRSVTPAEPAANVAAQLAPPKVLNLPAGHYPAMAAISGDARILAFVDDDGILLIGGMDRTNRFVQTAQLANPSGPLGSGSATGSGRLAVSPDGQWVATVDMFTVAAPHVFDARTGQLVKVLPTATAAVAFSPDGRWLATCGLKEFALWSVGDWSQVWHRPRSGGTSLYGGIAFAGDSATLAVTESLGVVGLVDRATGLELAGFTPPELPSNAGVRMSADGRRIVVPTLNSMLQVWEVAAVRGKLAELGLDWGQTAAAAPPAFTRSHLKWASPASAIMFGLACVTPATFFALWSLRRHRRLLHQFVQSEAAAQRRNRELEMAKIELMHGQKMNALGTLAAGIAHDFNNLLSVIRMSNQLIRRAGSGNPDVAEEVASIEEAVQQGKQVVGSMLGFSRKRIGDDGRCDLGEVVEETVSLLSREFLSGIELTLTLDRHAPAVQIGRGRIEQILLNLVVNAAEAMKGQGKLVIAVQPARPEPVENFVLRPRPGASLVELRVTDSGAGLAPKILPRIFEPFFTTKNSGSKQGTGLGLSMVYTIAEQAGLGIAVESMAGRGATFRILLPAWPPEAKAKTPQ